MDIEEIKNFMKKYRITQDSITTYVSYSGANVCKILKEKGKMRERPRLAFLLGMHNFLIQRQKLFEDALREWEKIMNDHK